MATQENNSVMEGVTGIFGKQVVFKKRRGKRYVAAPPNHDKNRKPGKDEQANRDRFKRSNEYASDAIKDDATKSMYAAVANQWQTAHNIAFSDAYHPPVITGIIANGYTGHAGNIIMVQAKDNFKVASVTVAVYDANNVLIEEGDAVDNGDRLNWIYTATQNLRGSKILVKAYDLPGNETVKEIIIGQ
jgi:hypothetical protein